MLKHIGKKSIKEKYSLTLSQISEIQVPDGTNLNVRWKRGEKDKNKGKLDKVTANNGVATFAKPQEIHMVCTLFVQKGGFDEKGFLLIVETEGKKKERWEGGFDLSKYGDLNGSSKTFELTLKGKKSSAKVSISITSEQTNEGGSSDETEIIKLKGEASTDIFSNLVEQSKVSKVKISEIEAEDEEEERLRKIQEAQRELQTPRTQESPQPSFDANVEIKGKKSSDKKYTEKDLKKAVDKELEVVKAENEKEIKRLNEQIEEIKKTKEEEKVCYIRIT